MRRWMMQAKDPAPEFLETLARIRLEAGEPRIGTREVELAGRAEAGPMGWPALGRLCQAGRITRRGGWCWITEEAFSEWCAARRSPSPIPAGSLLHYAGETWLLDHPTGLAGSPYDPNGPSYLLVRRSGGRQVSQAAARSVVEAGAVMLRVGPPLPAVRQ